MSRDPLDRIAKRFTVADDDADVCVSSWQDKQVPPRQWCVPDWVPDHVVTLLSGDGGTGKSLFAQQLATCCAMGLPFMGIELGRRKVLYLAAEDDLTELHRRQADINAAYNIDFADLEEQLWFRGVKGEAAILATTDRHRQLKPTPAYESLKASCLNRGIQLLIVDTVADTFGGLEIDRQQVTRYVRLIEDIARETDGAAIILAHPGVAGLANGTGISGSTAWRNAVRSVVYMRRPEQEQDGVDPAQARDLRIVERLKGNFAATGAELRIEWWRGSFCFVDKPTGTASAIDVIAAEAKVLAAIRLAHRQQRRMTFSKHSTAYAPKVLRDYKEVGGLKLSHIERAIASMLARGELREAHMGRSGHITICIVPGDAPRLDGERQPADGPSFAPD